MLQVQGNCLLQLGRTAEAKEKFQQALALAPEDTEVLLMMSRVLFSAEDYTQCAQTLRRLLRLSPGTWVAELLLSLCLLSPSLLSIHFFVRYSILLGHVQVGVAGCLAMAASFY